MKTSNRVKITLTVHDLTQMLNQSRKRVTHILNPWFNRNPNLPPLPDKELQEVHFWVEVEDMYND